MTHQQVIEDKHARRVRISFQFIYFMFITI